jgi:hypothetical protein
MRRTALLAAALSFAGLSSAHAAGVSVPMDEVRMISFPRAVSTVYVGNTVIAEINMIDSRHGFLLGKTFGETNMIALDADGREIANNHVTVFGRRTGMITLNRGPQQYNYTCTKAHCETQPVPGDQKAYFDETHNSIQMHEDMGVKAASNGAASAAPQ